MPNSIVCVNACAVDPSGNNLNINFTADGGGKNTGGSVVVPFVSSSVQINAAIADAGKTLLQGLGVVFQGGDIIKVFGGIV